MQSLAVIVYCLWYSDIKKLGIIHFSAILQIQCLHDCANASFQVGALSSGSALPHVSNFFFGTNLILLPFGKTTEHTYHTICTGVFCSDQRFSPESMTHPSLAFLPKFYILLTMIFK